MPMKKYKQMMNVTNPANIKRIDFLIDRSFGVDNNWFTTTRSKVSSYVTAHFKVIIFF